MLFSYYSTDNKIVPEEHIGAEIKEMGGGWWGRKTRTSTQNATVISDTGGVELASNLTDTIKSKCKITPVLD
jgi:hypothetical protein